MYKRLRESEEHYNDLNMKGTHSITWLDGGNSQCKVLPRDRLFILELETFYEM